MSKFYDRSSFAVLAQTVTANGGDVVASFQLAFITDRPRSDGLLLDRQHVMWTGSHTLLVERAYDVNASNGAPQGLLECLHADARRRPRRNPRPPPQRALRVDLGRGLLRLARHQFRHNAGRWVLRVAG